MRTTITNSVDANLKQEVTKILKEKKITFSSVIEAAFQKIIEDYYNEPRRNIIS